MDLYTKTSYATSKLLTLKYSTSFSSSTSLFQKDTARHIYAIYGLVRIADEIVDTYKGAEATLLLDDLEKEVSHALGRHYSTNPIVHAYTTTALEFDIDPSLLKAFFASMRLDLSPQTYTKKLYETYIYGSAEVVGLMCLAVFVDGDKALYKKLDSGARALGAAYQKVNFLRDLASEHADLDRLYFPGHTYDSFDEAAKQAVTLDIEKDIARAQTVIPLLPTNARRAVSLSLAYYHTLLRKLQHASIEQIKSRRMRVNNAHKWLLLVGVRMGVIGS